MKMIVSLTTWSKRINDCRTTIESMLKQTRRPDAIELNLDLINFPRGLADIPDWLKELERENDNFWIYFREKDLKVYQKFIPTIRRHCGTRYILVTLDDDNEYPTEYLERIEKNMENADWLCTTHDRFTFGKSNSDLPMERVLECPHLIKVMYEYDNGKLYKWKGSYNGRRFQPLCRSEQEWKKEIVK